MEHLHRDIGTKVREWREGGYPCDEFPAITEILEYQAQSEEVSDGALVDTLRFLRDPQRPALETYWYLRLIVMTPRISDLYAQMFPFISPTIVERLGMDSGDVSLFEAGITDWRAMGWWTL